MRFVRFFCIGVKYIATYIFDELEGVNKELRAKTVRG